ncbi:unnamed protein product [Protopolystoma xenopodis]|uniref:Uncharacterized protein n=1 Tax=Protopolystoma xenopodis TaxID=117903 RepID=A0A448WUA8_9PLAT|nr:unnamed protein product [Protopolystoma xenopodis]
MTPTTRYVSTMFDTDSTTKQDSTAFSTAPNLSEFLSLQSTESSSTVLASQTMASPTTINGHSFNYLLIYAPVFAFG